MVKEVLALVGLVGAGVITRSSDWGPWEGKASGWTLLRAYGGHVC